MKRRDYIEQTPYKKLIWLLSQLDRLFNYESLKPSVYRIESKKLPNDTMLVISKRDNKLVLVTQRGFEEHIKNESIFEDDFIIREQPSKADEVYKKQYLYSYIYRTNFNGRKVYCGKIYKKDEVFHVKIYQKNLDGKFKNLPYDLFHQETKDPKNIKYCIYNHTTQEVWLKTELFERLTKPKEKRNIKQSIKTLYSQPDCIDYIWIEKSNGKKTKAGTLHKTQDGYKAILLESKIHKTIPKNINPATICSQEVNKIEELKHIKLDNYKHTYIPIIK